MAETLDMLGNCLVQIREKLGYKSARQFYLWLEKNSNLEFNYSYYIKIESGKVIPSEKVVQTIARLLNENDAKWLVIEFCKNIFPDFKHFFSTSDSSKVKESFTAPDPKSEPHLRKQSSLSVKQVAAIARSKEHYFLFLVVSLARRRVKIEELQNKFEPGFLEKGIRELVEAKVIQQDDEQLFSISKELKFPSTEGQEDLRKIYSQLDGWDRDFSRHFGFTTSIRKFMLRRISPRFLPLIEKQSQQLVELIQMSEEVDADYNTETMQVSMIISTGKIPG